MEPDFVLKTDYQLNVWFLNVDILLELRRLKSTDENIPKKKSEDISGENKQIKNTNFIMDVNLFHKILEIINAI
jgi:hypothetical protein